MHVSTEASMKIEKSQQERSPTVSRNRPSTMRILSRSATCSGERFGCMLRMS
jgi:hypothetical protein